MKPSKSTNELSNQQQNQHQLAPSNGRRQPQQHHQLQQQQQQTQNHTTNGAGAGPPTSPICRCRVTYLGSSVPHITKDGLQGIQEPLRELYPDTSSLASGNAGIDSWLSVWSNGILVENIDETGGEVKRFFKIESLHYCAAVKYVPQTNASQSTAASVANGDSNMAPNFLPLDSPHARMHNNLNPPIFASILRRTTGVKVLECHAFICKREAAANALVRCCFHAYADTMYAKQIGADVDRLPSDLNNNEIKASNSIAHSQTLKRVNNARSSGHNVLPSVAARRSKSIANLNDVNDGSNGGKNSNCRQPPKNHQDINYATMQPRANGSHTMNVNSGVESYNQNMLNMQENMMRQQQKFSKSMHHLNHSQDQPSFIFDRPNDLGLEYYDPNQSTSYHTLSKSNSNWNPQDLRLQQQQVLAPPLIPPPQQPFYNPYSSRVPSYPPQNFIDQQQANSGGTMRSIKSITGNSIASTLLRSKKHAKAMSMAQLNQDKITSFHQPQSNASTMCRSFLMPPVPHMFLQNMPTIINGSQTMKLPSRPVAPIAGQPNHFEAMTPKDFKKLLKKSAKYGIDPTKFTENGLPILPLRQMPPIPPLPVYMPPPPPQMINNAGTFGGHSLLSMDMQNQSGHDLSDVTSLNQSVSSNQTSYMDPMTQQHTGPIKSILVKPNPEFLKSKAGKKWLKQQKEFKKLLPPHLDGLPIVFGPPPMDALEPALLPNSSSLPPPTIISSPQIGLPTMDSSGYYNPHPFYGPSGRASEASTLLRYSPHMQTFPTNNINGSRFDNLDHQQQRSQIYSNTMRNPQTMTRSQHQETYRDDSSLVYGNTELRVPERRFGSNNHHGNSNQAHNHMVEQSVISLGDENDIDDEEDGDDISSRQNGFYDQVGPAQSRSIESRGRNRDDHMQDRSDGQQEYEQVLPINDDQSSYSSGIYKRGHLNERAFSYSIQQEHKSSGGNSSEAEYVAANGLHQADFNRNGNITYEEPHSSNKFNGRREHSNGNQLYNRNESRGITVNELAARVENQLNMKSFANSRIKSNM